MSRKFRVVKGSASHVEGKNEYIPSSSVEDHGVDVTDSVKHIVDEIGTTKSATIRFIHDQTSDTTTYHFSTAETIPSNIKVIVENGARLEGPITLTINGPFNPGDYQVFGDSITVSFGSARKVNLAWFGNTTAAIQAALDSLCAGCELIVPKLTSHYSISTALDIDSVDDITLLFDPGAHWKMSASGANMINITKDRVSILGGKLEGEGTYVSDNSTTYRLITSSGDHTRVKDCYLHEAETCSIYISGDYPHIENNRIIGGPYFADAAAIGTDRQHYGIWLYESDYGKVIDNWVLPNSEANAGVTIQGIQTSSTGTPCHGLVITGNTVKDCWDHAIYASLEDSTVNDNQCYGCGIKVGMSGGITKTGNTITDNIVDIGGVGSKPLSGDTGLALNDFCNSAIQGNLVNDAADAGIYLYTSAAANPIENNVVSGNTIRKVRRGDGSHAYGIRVSDTNYFKNNVITANNISDIGEDTDGNNFGMFIFPSDTATHVGNDISHNVLENIQEKGMYLAYLTDSKIAGNVIRNTGVGVKDEAIYANDLNYCYIFGNMIVGVGAQMSYGYEESGSDHNDIAYNYIRNAQDGTTHGLGGNSTETGTLP